jgi:ubiquinone/menaquinone biosynthesis C-methylase UbiE
VSSQKSVFLNGEGDRYLRRNLSALEQGAIPDGVRLFSRYIRPGGRVLEIGCATGVRLAQLRSLSPCETWGIDPSAEATAIGNDAYPGVRLSTGTADQLPYADEFFDLVIFGFCLYLVDRSLLTRTMAEADRVLRSGGFLGITDFDVKAPVKRPYAHVPGVWSYKLDYGSLFASLPHLVMAEKISCSHAANGFTFDTQERVSTWVLAKDHEGAYIGC